MSPVTTKVRSSLNHLIVVSRVLGYVFSKSLQKNTHEYGGNDVDQAANLARSLSFILAVRLETTFSTAELLNVLQAAGGRMYGNLRGPATEES